MEEPSGELPVPGSRPHGTPVAEDSFVARVLSWPPHGLPTACAGLMAMPRWRGISRWLQGARPRCLGDPEEIAAGRRAARGPWGLCSSWPPGLQRIAAGSLHRLLNPSHVAPSPRRLVAGKLELRGFQLVAEVQRVTRDSFTV